MHSEEGSPESQTFVEGLSSPASIAVFSDFVALTALLHRIVLHVTNLHLASCGSDISVFVLTRHRRRASIASNISTPAQAHAQEAQTSH